MKETPLKIKTQDGHVIYTTLTTSEPKSDKLIVFVHGFTGYSNEHIFHNAAQFFPPKGYDVARFNLYWAEDDARKLTETTVTEHVSDFETVLEYFKNDYKNIYAVGHSLGGQVIVRSTSQQIKAAVLWDPSQEIDEMCKSFDYSEKLDAYVEHSNVDIIIGKNFVEDAKKLPASKDVISKVTYPVKVIGAEDAGAKGAEKLYYPNLVSQKEFYAVKGASHTFEELGTEKELFEETLKWIEKF